VHSEQRVGLAVGNSSGEEIQKGSWQRERKRGRQREIERQRGAEVQRCNARQNDTRGLVCFLYR
jgi:hypothetical protein